MPLSKASAPLESGAGVEMLETTPLLLTAYARGTSISCSLANNADTRVSASARAAATMAVCSPAKAKCAATRQQNLELGWRQCPLKDRKENYQAAIGC